MGYISHGGPENICCCVWIPEDFRRRKTEYTFNVQILKSKIGANTDLQCYYQAGLMLMINAGLMAFASSIVNREKYSFGALSLTMSHSHTTTVAKGAFYFHKGDWCLWGRGPELEQGTSLTGTGHPFNTPNTSMVMNLWGKAKVNELRPTWPLRRENEGKGVGGKKDGDSRTAR